MTERKLATGALAGWRRSNSEHGCVFKLQVAETWQDFKERDFVGVEIALNDRQLRSFTRDLIRASTERGLDLGEDKKKRSLFNFFGG